MSHEDVGSLVEAATIAHELNADLDVKPFDRVAVPAGSVAEFCIGGPSSNDRSRVHLENYLPAVSMNPYNHESAPLAITIDGDTYGIEKNVREYALLARLLPTPESHPVFLICGQTSIANRGATHYLLQNRKTLRKQFGSRPFCLVVRVASPWTYGYRMTALENDITGRAFRRT
jgi:hypothetical protein